MYICKSKNTNILITLLFLVLLTTKPAFAAEQASFNYDLVEQPRLEIQRLLDSHPESIEVIAKADKQTIIVNDFLEISNINATINRWKYTAKKLDNGQACYTFYPEYKASSNLIHKVSNNNCKTLTPDEKALLKQANNILDTIITSDMDELQKANAIYRYVINTVSYDYEAANNSSLKRDMPEASANGVFEGRAICLGYSDGLYLLLELAGIHNEIVTGFSPSGGFHAWNRVHINGQTLYIDATWGDGKNPSDFFCKTFDEFQHKGYQILTV